MVDTQPQPTPAAPSPKPAKPGTFSLLKDSRNFRLLWISSVFFFTGSWIQGLVMAWIAYEVTGSPLLLSIFSAVRLLPMLAGPLGGVLAQRFDRMSMLLWTQVFGIVVTLVLAGLAAAGQTSYPVLLVTGFLLGIAQWPTQPARTTLVTDIVSRENISAAMALNHLPQNGTQVIGPLLGGVLMTALGPTWALLISALWYVGGIVAMWPIRHVGRRPPVVGAAPLQALARSTKVVLGNRLMRTVLSISATTNLLVWAAYQTFLPVFAKDVLHVEADGLGLLQTIFGAGTLAAALAIASLGDFSWKGKLFLWGTAAFGFFYAMFALSDSFWASATLLLIAGAASSAFGVMQRTLLLRLAPIEVRDQAIGVLILAIGILPLGSVIQGAVADAIGGNFGVSATTFTVGMLLVVHALSVLVLVPGLRKLH